MNIPTNDWLATFYSAVQYWLHGGSPYLSGTWFVSPPWILPLLAPFALLPPQIGIYAVDGVTLTGMVALAARLRRPWLALVVATSYAGLYLFVNSNVDGFVLWGLALGGPVGFYLLTIKPQMTSVIILFWLWQAWQADRWRGVLRLAAPTAVIASVFTALYPQWFAALRMIAALPQAHDANLWPWLLPLALVAGLWTIRHRRPAGAAVASVLAAPYLVAYSYVAALALVTDEVPLVGLVASLLSWAYVFFIRLRL